MTVVISEFLAGNDDGIQDAAGHRHDWIELRNSGAAVEDVSGWYLTDDSADLTKWQLPATAETTSLAPGETLLIFASGDNGEAGVVGGELHTNFQLSQEAGYLGLVEGDGTTIAHQYNLYPQQSEDVSYGLGVGVNSTTSETLLSAGSSSTGDGSPVQFRPYTGPNASVDDHWTEIDYVASGGDGWQNKTNGLGFGYGSPWQDSSVSLSGEISGYVRMPFTVTDRAQLTSMSLDLRVDNGYILFLNGREVQRERVATNLKIGNDWELNARQNLSDSEILNSPTQVDLTPWLDTIEEGDNVLAIYAANHTQDSGDFLVHAELTAERANGAEAFTYMVDPTPGAANGAGYLGVIADTIFSHDRGFYSSPFDLTISTVEPGATIRYTTDGTRPTLTNGQTYSGPININPATLSHTGAGVVMVRAAAFKSGYYATNVDTQSYVFLDHVLGQDSSGVPSHNSWGHNGADWAISSSIVSSVGAENLKNDLQSIPTMSLVMDWEELFGDGSEDGIYTQESSWRQKSDERYASLEFFTADQSEEFQIDSVVEIQGHSSTNRWNNDKLSFQVKFKQPYDTKLESDSLFGNSTADGENAANDFDTLILDAQHNYTFTHGNQTRQGPYATYIHDQVVADLSNLADGEAAHGRWVHLYINGLYWGIYNAHERPSDGFAEEYYGGDKDDYLVVKGFEGINKAHGGTQPKYLQDDGGLAAEIAYEVLIDQVNDNLASLTEYQQVADILDIDSFINYMVVLFYAGNYDWGELNWFASINDADPNGKWRFHSWDQEHAFPTDQNGVSGVTNSDPNYDHTALVANDFGEHEYGPTGIHHYLMQSEEYRLRFSDRVEELLRNDGVLTPANAQAVWQARVDELSGAINGEAARWGDNRGPLKTGATWLTNVQYTADHFFLANGPYQSRTDILIGIFNNTIAPGGSDEVGKVDWLVDLDAPVLSQYGGEFSAPYGLTLTNPNGAGTIYYTLDGSDPRTAGGGVSPTAIAYSGTINLTDATRVRARVLDTAQSGTADDWSAEVDKQFVLADPLPLRIVELMYNPTGNTELEYIELLNTGSEAIDLTGVAITDFSSGGYTFDSLMLGAGERIVVPENVAAFQAAYPSVTNVTATAYSGNLSNGGELITLRDALGAVLQSFEYDDETPWPTAPDEGGPSLEYVGPFDADAADPTQVAGDPYDDPANWQASAAVGGTPGAAPASLLVGDYDGNGFVEEADFGVWLATYGSTTDLRADGNNDNRVDAIDFAVWREAIELTLAPAPTPAPAPATASADSPAPAPVAAVAVADEGSSIAPDDAVEEAVFYSTPRAERSPTARRDGLSSARPAPAPQEDLLLLLAVDQAGPAPAAGDAIGAAGAGAAELDEGFAGLDEVDASVAAELRYRVGRG